MAHVGCWQEGGEAAWDRAPVIDLLLPPALGHAIAQADPKQAELYPKADVNASASEQHLRASPYCAALIKELQLPSR